MARVTRALSFYQARDLLLRVPRASLAFSGEQGPVAEPVHFRLHHDRYLVGIRHDALERPGEAEEVVLVVDQGVQFFELRAVYIRGRVEPTDAPPRSAPGLGWYEIIPRRTLAWDYGRLRWEGQGEDGDEDGGQEDRDA